MTIFEKYRLLSKWGKAEFLLRMEGFGINGGKWQRWVRDNTPVVKLPLGAVLAAVHILKSHREHDAFVKDFILQGDVVYNSLRQLRLQKAKKALEEAEIKLGMKK